jgi:Tfp pilus assembly protein PilF
MSKPLPQHLRRLLLCIAWALLVPAHAAPYIPESDQQVLETLPASFGSPLQRELRALRSALAADPRNLDKAIALARRYYQLVAAEGDPRYIGYAQAALAPWWELSDPPVKARVMRATLLQFNHGFDAAVADLLAAVQAEPDNVQAWAWLAAIGLVRADLKLARRACGRLQTLAPPLIARACVAQIDALTGSAARAAADLRMALVRYPGTDAAQRLWALTRLAETQAQMGDAAAAEASFKSALELGLNDQYLLAAYADLLLDQGRPGDVLVLLKDKTRSDLLLLRLALAAKALGDPALAAWRDELAARFDAAQLRGDSVHEKEESRFALGVLGQSERALALASSNFTVQREPADARILLQAALAARQPDAAQPALRWLADTGHDDLVLNRLARQVRSLK